MSDAEPGAPPPKKGLERLPTRVLSVERPSDGLVHLGLERPGGSAYRFEPGQFTYLYPPDGGERRAYSIASPPQVAERLDFCVKRVVGGPVSPRLYDLRPGDELHLTKALGGFRFRTPPRAMVVYLATGTGVAPFRAMIRQRLHERDPRIQWLLLGSREQANLPYHPEWLELEKQAPSFRYVPVLSKAPLYWQGDRGWIQEAFLRRFYHDSDYHAYVCGVRRMVEDVSGVLRERGLGREAIHLERYD